MALLQPLRAGADRLIVGFNGAPLTRSLPLGEPIALHIQHNALPVCLALFRILHSI